MRRNFQLSKGGSAFVLPPLCLRSPSVVPSLCLRFRFAPIDGASTDLQRIYNGPALEGVESSRRISLKPVFSLGNGFGMVFTFYTIFQAY